ncbi:hypothetical protein evm_001389 [Chilo suppressalis]|nr:hypothetical protein evm_001389 [Chilo suppressalis]
MDKENDFQTVKGSIKGDLSQCTVSGGVYRAMWWARCFGVAPLRFWKADRADGWRVRISPTAFVLGCIFVILLDISILASPFVNPNPHSRLRRSHTRWVILMANYIIMSCLTSNAVFGGRQRTRQIITCLDRVNKMDKTISAEYIKLSSGKDVKIYVIIILTILMSVLGSVVDCWEVVRVKLNTDINILFADLNNNPMFLMMHFIVMMTRLQFTVSSFKVFTTIRSINDVLEQVELTSSNRKYMLAVPGYRKLRPIEDVIRQMSSMYVSTCDVVEQLDSCCGPNLLLLLMSCFLQLVTQSYWLSQNLFISMRSFPRMLSNLIWCVCQIMWLVEIVEPCHRTKLETGRTKLLISKLSGVLNTRPILVELEKLAQYLEMNQVGYAPLGICVLSRSLIAGILANVTTYLVVIIQFQTTDT